MKRQIIKIDEETCTGCGLCIPNCPEGALQIIDGKARLVSELFCDGLGACIGNCPENAITTEFREAQAYDEHKVMERIVAQGPNTVKAHLKHLQDHGQIKLLQQAKDFLRKHDHPIPGNINKEIIQNQQKSEFIPSHLKINPDELKLEGCPEGGCLNTDDSELAETSTTSNPNIPENSIQETSNTSPNTSIKKLNNWPIQIRLTPVKTRYFNDAQVLIAADCVVANHPTFHQDLLKEKTLLMGCPKFDDQEYYAEKLTQIFAQNSIRSIDVAIMEVPCCSGMINLVKSALKNAGKEKVIPVFTQIIPILTK